MTSTSVSKPSMLVDRLVHRHDVLGRRDGLEVVAWGADPSGRSEDPQDDAIGTDEESPLLSHAENRLSSKVPHTSAIRYWGLTPIRSLAVFGVVLEAVLESGLAGSLPLGYVAVTVSVLCEREDALLHLYSTLEAGATTLLMIPGVKSRSA